MESISRAHRLENVAAGAVQGIITALPERFADRLMGAAGGLIHRPFGIRRATVHENLRRAYPDASEAWIRQTARAAYRHLGREAAAMIRLARLQPADIVTRTEMVGWEAFQEAVAEGRGVILAAGHFGNWEIAAAAVAARGVPLSAIVQRQSNPLIDARIQGSRHRFGVRTIERGDAPRQVPRALRAGHVVGVVIDQDARRSGVWVPFFGHPSSTPRGAALFALRFGVPVFSIMGVRLPGKLRYRIELERVTPRRTDDLAADLVDLTAELTARLEAAIRQRPEQYFWFHRRWKTPPPAEHPPAASGTNPGDHEGAQPEDRLV
jgi:Kdo2-lipid IVA lauroyltransferase/acyltransferase